MELITGVVSGYSDFHPVRSLLKPPRLQHARPAAKPSGGIEEDDTASADKIEFTGNIKEAFKQLGTYRDSPRNLKAAKVFLERYFGLVPHHFPTDELVCHISVALGLKPPEQREVADHAQVLYEVRRKHYIKTVELTPEGSWKELEAGIDEFFAAYEANPGVKWLVIIKAPHGSGKNQICLKRALEYLKLKALITNHRRALCADAANTLGVQHYMNAQLDPSGDLVCCVNSLASQELQDYLHSSRFVCIDEAAQVLSEVLNRNGTVSKGAGNAAILDSLSRLVQAADVVFLMDADLDDWTVKQFQRLTPDKKPFVIHQPFTKQDRTVRYGDFSQTRRTLKEALLAGHTIWISSDSAEYLLYLRRKIEAWYAKAKMEYKVSIVTSKEGHETTHEPEIARLLANINEHAHEHGVLLVSPVMMSGVSLITNHFNHHFFFYRGVVTPAEFNQMMLRDRTWKACYLGLYGTYNPHESAGELITREVAAEQYKAEVLEQDYTFDPKDALNLLCKQRDDRRSRVLTNPPQSLLMLLEHRGYDIVKMYSRSCPDSMAEVKRLTQLEFREAVRRVGAVSDQDIRDIQKKLMNKTREDSLKLISYEIHACLNLKQYEYLTDAHFDLWDDGRLAKRKARLQRLYSDRDEDKPAQLAVLKLLTHAGIDFETGEGVVTEKSALDAWRLMSKCKDGLYLVHEGWLPPFRNNPPVQPVRWVSDFLGKFWLALEAKQGVVHVTAEALSCVYNNASGVQGRPPSNSPPSGQRQRVYHLNSVRKELGVKLAHRDPHFASEATLHFAWESLQSEWSEQSQSETVERQAARVSSPKIPDLSDKEKNHRCDAKSTGDLTEEIKSYLDGQESVSINDVLAHLSIETATQAHLNAVGRILRELGWKHYRARVPVTPENPNGRQWRYRPGEPPQATEPESSPQQPPLPSTPPNCKSCLRYSALAVTCGAAGVHVLDMSRPPCHGGQFQPKAEKRISEKEGLYP